MLNKGRSALTGQIGKLIGFGFAPHPLNTGHFIEFVFYKTATEYVLCLSEGTGVGDPVGQRRGLGADIAGAAFAPYAQRSIDGKMAYEDFKKLMNDTLPESVPGLTLEWWK